MNRTTLALSLALALGAAWVPASPAAPHAAASPEDPVAEWDAQWNLRMKEAAREYLKVAKWCEDNNLEQTGIWIKRRVLRYFPDDEETRKFYGYSRDPATGKWVRDEVRADQLRAAIDLDDPKAGPYEKKVQAAEKKIANSFRGLARKAEDNGKKDPASAAAWTEKARRAWERVIEVEPQAEDAHKALGNPRFEGKYCTPFKFRFVEVRAARKKAGEKTNASAPTAEPVPADGLIKDAGLTAEGAKSEHMVINSTHGKNHAVRLAQSSEKAVNDLLEMYGWPEQVKDRLIWRKYYIVKDDGEWKQFMEKGAKWDPKEIKRYEEAGLKGVDVAPGERVTAPLSTGVDGDDACMNMTAMAAAITARQLAIADMGSPTPGPFPEDWLRTSIAYDCTKRVLGTNITIWGAFGKYGQNVSLRPGMDLWIELARRQAEADDDVPLSRLYKLQIDKQEIKGPETVKGYAFLQFLFESDTEKARKFVWQALAQGTPAAAAAVYPWPADSPDFAQSLDHLDEEYREWILKAW